MYVLPSPVDREGLFSVPPRTIGNTLTFCRQIFRSSYVCGLVYKSPTLPGTVRVEQGDLGCPILGNAVQPTRKGVVKGLELFHPRARDMSLFAYHDRPSFQHGHNISPTIYRPATELFRIVQASFADFPRSVPSFWPPYPPDCPSKGEYAFCSFIMTTSVLHSILLPRFTIIGRHDIDPRVHDDTEIRLPWPQLSLP